MADGQVQASTDVDVKAELLKPLEMDGLELLKNVLLPVAEQVIKNEVAKLQGEAAIIGQALLASVLPALDAGVKAKITVIEQGL